MTTTALWCILVILSILCGYAAGRTDERNYRRFKEFERERDRYDEGGQEIDPR